MDIQPLEWHALYHQRQQWRVQCGWKHGDRRRRWADSHHWLPQQRQTYFDTSAFAAPIDARFGTGGRNIVRGPGFTNLDASVFRNFKLTERFTFQFRAEGFGVTNTPHFDNPLNARPANVSQANFGVITDTLSRGNQGNNLNGARTFWFAGKLIF